MRQFYEFFAGAGMARAGLGPGWSCLFANDIDHKKAASYRENWGESAFLREDIARLSTKDLPGRADLAWASFPCQDLSLAGSRAGLAGKRSGTFWRFWRLMKELSRERREPNIIVLENVCGTLTSNAGRDFLAISSSIAKLGYRFGALIINAIRFVPQSRPRLFIVAVREGMKIPRGIFQPHRAQAWSTDTLESAVGSFPNRVRKMWVWWHLPPPPERSQALSNIIEDEPEGVSWHPESKTQKLLEMMNSTHSEKVRAALRTSDRVVGTIYRRMRPDGDGRNVQRTEVRFDGNAGCLRSSRGGSSRQTVITIEKSHVPRSRLLSPREAARLMGLPDDYKLPPRYNEAYDLVGEGVAVPVVRYLAAHVLEPILNKSGMSSNIAKSLHHQELSVATISQESSAGPCPAYRSMAT